MSNERIAAVTGANGLVGGIACDALVDAGFRTRRLVRRPEAGSEDRHFVLGCEVAPEELSGVDVLVHCAYDMKVTGRREVWETNVFGTRLLLDAAVAAGVRRTIVISSMSAYPGTRQLYGRAKLAAEMDARSRGALSVRLGLVYGERWGGMAGVLRRLASTPMVLIICPRSHQFTTHEADLAAAFRRLATGGVLPEGPLGLAHPEPQAFATILRAFSKRGNPPILVPIPWRAVYAVIRLAELSRMPLPVRADSVLGLARPGSTLPGAEHHAALGLRFRQLAPPPT